MGKMTKIAYEVWRNLVDAGISEEQACRCVASQLSEKHANLLNEHVAKQAGMNATVKHNAGGNLSIHERLHMAKHHLHRLRIQIDATKKSVYAIPSSYKGTLGAVYECNDCGYCTSFGRYRYDGGLVFIREQGKSCINPSCTRRRRAKSDCPNAKGIATGYKLPTRLNANNDRWSFREVMTGSEIIEYDETREEACKEKIARLEEKIARLDAQKDDEVHRSDEEWPMATATILGDENRKRKRLMEDMAPIARSRYTAAASESPEDRIRREIRRLETELRDDKLVKIEDMYNVNDFKDPFPFLS